MQEMWWTRRNHRSLSSVNVMLLQVFYRCKVEDLDQAYPEIVAAEIREADTSFAALLPL